MNRHFNDEYIDEYGRMHVMVIGHSLLAIRDRDRQKFRSSFVKLHLAGFGRRQVDTKLSCVVFFFLVRTHRVMHRGVLQIM